MEFLLFLVLLIINPVVLCGLLVLFFSYLRRIKNERKYFRTAINNDFFEGRYYIKNALKFGFLNSIITMLLGVELTKQWIFVYMGIMAVGIILSFYVDLNSILLLVFTGGTIGIASLSLFDEKMVIPASLQSFAEIKPGIIFLILTVFYLTKLSMLKSYKQDFFQPKIYNGKRGRRLIRYSLRDQTVLPLIVLVPGNLIHSLIPVWPILSLGGQSFTLFVLPLWISWTLKLWRNSVEMELQKAKADTQQKLVITIIGTILGLWFPITGIFVFIILLLLVGLRFVQRYAKMKRKGKWYAETHDGIRVVAVRPETPAAKMNLEIGDVIIMCNGIHVTTESEFYEALQKNSAYCKLKIRTYEGQLKLAESAIFADSPHEIGVVLFR
ncbi:MAG: PDZ domain-containing protein [Liquorilactobacillus hordei]|uniref:PDZ domain-containing protein n=1 Tax=Liquorilactobacillus hordei TaxID=468911 RepID=A0A3Q8CX74_9LACO|nr:PDZ domain-containing protein [Liquorilactobacillus hordei]AUJ29265.1 PDZ domain-containing protein [Liquorilactobacillus hordei]